MRKARAGRLGPSYPRGSSAGVLLCQRADHLGQVGELGGGVLVAEAEGDVAAGAVHLDGRAVGPTDAAATVDATAAPDVQAGPGGRDLGVGGRAVLQDGGRPVGDLVTVEAVVEVDAHDAVAVEDEAEAFAVR